MSDLLKKRFVDQIKVLFGAEPTKPFKPEQISPVAQEIHFYKKGNRSLIDQKHLPSRRTSHQVAVTDFEENEAKATQADDQADNAGFVHS